MAPSTQWNIWGSEIEVRVTEWAALGEADAIVRAALERVQQVCDLGCGTAEIHEVNQAQGTPVRVSRELRGLIRAALWAARMTGGVVTPLSFEAPDTTTGSLPSETRMSLPSETQMSLPSETGTSTPTPEPGFADIRVDGELVFAPFGAFLDLTATAKAVTVHRAARRAADTLECGVLARVDDVVGTWGHCPIGGWQVELVPSSTPRGRVEVQAGHAMATARAPSPMSGEADSGLEYVSVAEDDALWAYAAASAALQQGVAALRWLTERDLAARIVYRHGSTRTTDAWLHLSPYGHVA